MILATDTLTTILVRQFGLGKHSYDLNIYNPSLFILLINSRATTTLTSLAWTKTAFAVALLRLTTDRTKAFVWFIIISVNITLGFSAAVPFIQCQPLAKAWQGELPGNCWAPGVGTKIWIGTGGRLTAQHSCARYATANVPVQRTPLWWTLFLPPSPGHFCTALC
jgi:hypothetical protein